MVPPGAKNIENQGVKHQKLAFFAQNSTFTRILKLETSFCLLQFGFTNTKYLLHFMEAGKLRAFTQNMAKPGVKMAKYYFFSLKFKSLGLIEY